MPVLVPLRRPLGTSAARMSDGPFALVDVETSDGVIGRAYAYCYLPAAAPIVCRLVATAAEALLGGPADPQSVRRTLDARFKLVGVHGLVMTALSVIDVACWDALAVAAAQPLSQLLGATRASVPAYNSNGLSIGEPAALGREAQELLDAGFAAVKLRLGYPSAADDLAAVASVREAVGAEATLMVDYNQALDVDQAIERGLALEAANLAWIEEPIAADDLVGAARVAAALETPLQLGENLYGCASVGSVIALCATDYLMFDLMRIGGVSGWLAASRLAAAAAVPVSSHLYPEVSSHLLAATPGAHWLEYVDWAEPVLTSGVELRDGAVQISSTPGCGVDWDDEAVARYSMD